MATYKVIQDIEAEDKLVGPLSLKQFIYAGIAALCLYLCFIAITKNAAYLLVLFFPPAALFIFLAFPWRRDQPTEIWALAKIRFLFIPRKRIWDQSGVKQLVTITAPKRLQEEYTNGLSQTEVKSRLKTLADTIDSRGWAIKNVNVNMFTSPLPVINNSTDRLIDASNMPKEVPSLDITAADDIMDEQSNPVAHHFEEMINASAQEHRQQIQQKLQQPNVDHSNQTQTKPQDKPNDYWFLNTSDAPKSGTTMFKSQVVAPGSSDDDDVSVATPTADEKDLSEELKRKHGKPEIAYSHLKNIEPLSSKKKRAKNIKHKLSKFDSQTMTDTPDPDILQLASNNDLNVATLARQANHDTPEKPGQDEVVISLR